MRQQKTATVWTEGGDAIIRCPFVRGFVDDLKRKIDRDYRKWDAGGKIWKVDIAYLDELVEVAQKYFQVILVEPEVYEEPKQLSSGGDPYHDLICDLPKESLKKVYQLAAIAHHPDRGGNEETMRKVNAAWERLK